MSACADPETGDAASAEDQAIKPDLQMSAGRLENKQVLAKYQNAERMRLVRNWN